MKILERYQQMVARGAIDCDAVQLEVISHLQKIADVIDAKRVLSLRKKKAKGLYVYGPVGAGKTFMMDLFFSNVLTAKKKRVHLHQFMQEIDAELRRRQGQVNPIQRIAISIAKSTKLLCFDEFIVKDIATAMILAELLECLFKAGVTLIATSNIPPDELYLNGLQRVRFLPTIALIKEHCEIISLPEVRDYRLNRAPFHESYFYPHNVETLGKINSIVAEIAIDDVNSKNLLIQGREIQCLQKSANIVWFDFKTICSMPRSQLDYLEIANRYRNIVVSDVPALKESDSVSTLLLIHLIDVMYDKKVRLILSAQVPIDEIYTKGDMLFSFRRALSRLQEMQSLDYFKQTQERAN